MVIDALAEERAREAAQAGQDRFLPRADGTVTAPTIPTGFGLEGPGSDPNQSYLRVDEEEAARVGGTGEYMEMHHPADLVGWSSENVAELREMWRGIFGGECPYDFDDPASREIDYEMALWELDNMYFSKISTAESEVDVLESGGVDVRFKLMGLNKFARELVDGFGGVEALRDIWHNCKVVTLKKPYDEKSDWVIIMQAWKDNGKGDNSGAWKRFAMKLPDFEEMLVTGEGDNERYIELPTMKSGDADEKAQFKVALRKMKMEGETLGSAALFIEDLPKQNLPQRAK